MPEKQLILPVRLARRRKRLNVRESAGVWPLSSLFGPMVLDEYYNDILGFEMQQYIYFLDHVETVSDLVRGLEELSPFADDALEIAEWMSREEFEEFQKVVPAHHQAVREGNEPTEELSDRFTLILLPEQFFSALSIAESAAVSLGVALIRFWEVIYSKKSRTSPIIHCP